MAQERLGQWPARLRGGGVVEDRRAEVVEGVARARVNVHRRAGMVGECAFDLIGLVDGEKIVGATEMEDDRAAEVGGGVQVLGDARSRSR